jgi:molybdopterin synthase catalytic subunit
MFQIVTASINTLQARESLLTEAAGAFVSFEGWVRNSHEGKRVRYLEYESYPSLAVREGERIVKEAEASYPILKACCIHRVGSLQIGEMAVWVGVVGAHRDEAFAACRFIIDEVKRRVPIWKKEYYLEENPQWLANQGSSSALHSTPACATRSTQPTGR